MLSTVSSPSRGPGGWARVGDGRHGRRGPTGTSMLNAPILAFVFALLLSPLGWGPGPAPQPARSRPRAGPPGPAGAGAGGTRGAGGPLKEESLPRALAASSAPVSGGLATRGDTLRPRPGRAPTVRWWSGEAPAPRGSRERPPPRNPWPSISRWCDHGLHAGHHSLVGPRRAPRPSMPRVILAGASLWSRSPGLAIRSAPRPRRWTLSWWCAVQACLARPSQSWRGGSGRSGAAGRCCRRRRRRTAPWPPPAISGLRKPARPAGMAAML